ncbi:MAG: GldG family protein, partial [Alphaproteobacteria bacterium]
MADKTQKQKSWLDDKRRTAQLSLVVAAIFLIALNALAGNLFRGATVDFTQDKAYTLSPGTQKVLTEIAEPITLRFFYSTKLGETVPQYGAMALRVRELLERYASLSRGRIKLEIANPEPFSDAEDRAASYGLQGVPVDQSGEQVYFGLIGTN